MFRARKKSRRRQKVVDGRVVDDRIYCNMQSKFEEDTWETFQVIALTRSNYSRIMWKIAINRTFWIHFQPLLNLSKNCLLVTCITNLKRIHEKLFKLSRPQGQIIDVKCEKSQKIGHFQPLLNLSENWSLVTCITNLRSIHEKLFKLSHSQVNVNAATPNFNCNRPPF